MSSEIALQAGFFLEYLSKPGRVDAEWDTERIEALDIWRDLEQDIFLCDTTRDSEDRMEPVKRFVELCRDLHTALPYNEAERHWLLERLDTEADLKRINQLEGYIVSSGVRQTVRGRDLMRRWISWHRETDEYAGQNTLGVARSALAGLIGLLEPKKELPEAYLALMRERDATP